MPVVHCPHCRGTATVPAQAGGKKVRCPRCQKPFTIPALAPSPAAAPKSTSRSETPQIPAKSPSPPRPTPTPPKRPRPWRGFAIGGAAFLTTLVTIFVVRSFLRGPAPSSDPKWSPEDKYANINPTPTPSKKEPPAPIKPRPPRTEPFDLADPPGQAVLAMLVTRLNAQRKWAGLGPTRLDDDLSRGCQLHAEYLARNLDHPRIAGGAGPTGVQDQDASLAGFHEEGKKAAQASLIAFAAPDNALELWLGQLLGRLPLLQIDLGRIGVGAARNVRGDWVCVVDPTRGIGHDAVVYPGPDQSDIPLVFSGGAESPDKTAGFPVSLQVPDAKSLRKVQAHLRDVNGNRIATSLSIPDAPLPGIRRSDLVGLIPQKPLSPRTRYHAFVSLDHDGRPLEKSWYFTTEDDGDEAGVWSAKMLQRLNETRRGAGLEEVALDPDLCKSCRDHARYVAINSHHPAVQGLGAHEEDLSLPGATPEGKAAGKASNIAIGDYEPLDAFDGWLATLYHRVPMLEPGLKKIGFGCARGDRLGWVTVLDVSRGRDPKRPRPGPVFYPADKQKDIPLIFPPGGELPNPIPDDKDGRAGFPITVFFPMTSPLKNARGRLENDSGREVACWFSSPDSPANPKFEKARQGTTVCLVPKDPLQPQQTYRATVSGERDGAAWTLSWTFQTGSPGLSLDRARLTFLERFNQARIAAGVAPVRIDDDLSRACQAHADYLIKNSDRRGDKTFSVNDEDSMLPGFSLEGQQAARRSDVFSLAPHPATQVDDLFASLSRRGFALDPRLRRIGLGCALEVGQGWVNVLDLNSGRDEIAAVFFPASGQEQVPIQGRDRLPDGSAGPIGFPITAAFPPQQKVRNARATLADSTGASMDIWLSSPESPFDPGAIVNVIAVHPRRPLRGGLIYTISMTAEVAGRPWRQTWRFAAARVE